MKRVCCGKNMNTRDLDRQVLYKTTIDTPIGTMVAVSTVNGLALLEFADRSEARLEQVMSRIRGRIAPGSNEILQETANQLRGYFSKKIRAFNIPLQIMGTEFERSVWERLQQIPWGETETYAQVARDIGRSRAVRAVGTANGKNRLAIVIPCHRVIGGDNKLHGYGGGLWRKEWLLAHERSA